MAPEAIFIAKFNTRLQKSMKIHLSTHNFRQGCQIVHIENSADRSGQYLSFEVLSGGFERHFHREVQHSPSKKYESYT